MTTLGFIGLGNMGGPMATNAVKAGFNVKVFDLSKEAISKACDAGANSSNSVADAVTGVDVVLTMLPAGGNVRSVYLEDGGVLDKVLPGTLLIDSSTIDVTTAREVADEAHELGFDMVDAPVSGGVAAAQAGTLTFMVGGEDQAFVRAKPILDTMGQNIIHAGSSGSGQAAKICNNMLLGISMIGTCEAFALADKLGLDRQKLFDIASNASGQCWSLTSYCPVPGPVPAAPSNRDYQPGFAVAMMLKDLKLAQEAAHTSGASTPLGEQATALYGQMSADGHDGLDFSGIFKYLTGEL